jgi:hypothetical protein
VQDCSEVNGIRSKSSLGKGREGVTAWATYRHPADMTPTASNPSTPAESTVIGSELEGCSRRGADLRMLGQYDGAADDNEQKYVPETEDQDEKDWPLTTNQLPTRSIPSLIREQRERDRWSGSTVITP